ncbi:MAG: amidohydrolase family protein [Caulobacterales bacterium]|nr:amidohydrolase family protein [Caulobacterales bacterium]
MRLPRLLLLAALAIGCAGPAAAAPTLVRDVRLFDGDRVQEHRSVLFQDGVIVRVSDRRLNAPGAEVVDGRGRTLLPGLIDAHVHLLGDAEGALRQSARFGVTTVLDMFSGPKTLEAVRKLRADPQAGLADARVAGYGATAPGSLLSRMTGQPWPTVDGPAEAEAWVDARIAEGSDYIKVVYDENEGGPLSQDTLAAIVRAAHQRGRLVVVHVLAEAKAREAIAAGADGLAHLFIGDAAGADFPDLAAQAHVFITPTLTILHSLCGEPVEPGLLSDPRIAARLRDQDKPLMAKAPTPSRNHLCAASRAVLAPLAARRVPILAGTDTAPRPIGPYGVLGFGATLHAELALLTDDGLTPLQALTAATSAPADAFRLNDRGRIQPGRRADLLLVEGDPTKDIRMSRNIVAVWVRGDRVPSP